MRTAWIIFAAMAFVILTVFLNLGEGAYLNGAASRLDILLNVNGTLAWNPISLWNYLTNLVGIITFDYAYFTGSWVIVRYLLTCIGIGIIISLLISIRGGSST